MNPEDAKEVHHLQRRIGLFLAIPMKKLDHLALKMELDSIGKSA